MDKKIIKEKLEEEKNILLEQLKDMGTLNPETGEWEATPEEQLIPATDPNDMADRFEDFEAKSALIKTLEPRLKDVLNALKHINKETFGRCLICKDPIEEDRLEANGAARTCKKHLES